MASRRVIDLRSRFGAGEVTYPRPPPRASRRMQRGTGRTLATTRAPRLTSRTSTVPAARASYRDATLRRFLDGAGVASFNLDLIVRVPGVAARMGQDDARWTEIAADAFGGSDFTGNAVLSYAEWSARFGTPRTVAGTLTSRSPQPPC